MCPTEQTSSRRYPPDSGALSAGLPSALLMRRHSRIDSSQKWKLRELVWVGGCVTARTAWASPPGRRRRSVHRSAKMTSRIRFGAFVYTVATRVATRIASRAAQGGTSASTTTACRRHPLAGPSRLVGKTGSERVAPLPGRHLGRGVNPHEPPKSLRKSITIDAPADT